jgi:hypothetical protein
MTEDTFMLVIEKELMGKKQLPDDCLRSQVRCTLIELIGEGMTNQESRQEIIE